jgi:hypothetical protein
MLLIVLIGIALFAALSFAITRNNRYDTGASENAAIQAQQITSYAEKINGAVQNIMLQNHCLASQISFANSTVAGYTNGANTSCQVFDQTGAGGGMIFQTPPPPAIDTASATTAGSALAGNYLFEGNLCVSDSGTGPPNAACSASNAELIFIMPWVTQAVCAQIDWIAMKSTTIPTVSAATFDGTKFTGTFAGTYTITTSGTTFPSGCYQSSSSPPGTGYHFYEVLIAN